MFRMECPAHPEAGCLAIWNGNAAEQLEALVGSWQPIDTAPKDRVVLVNDTTGMTPWSAAYWREVTEWSGWIYDDEAAADNNPLGPQPTHWFDVPPVP